MPFDFGRWHDVKPSPHPKRQLYGNVLCEATHTRQLYVSLYHILLWEELYPALSLTVGVRQVGMVAWKMTLVTPEYPTGRDIIVIANDLTHAIGSFGPCEDVLFLKASQVGSPQ